MSNPPTSTPTPAEPPDPAGRPYRAYGDAARMWADRSAEVVLEGPADTGKSRAVLEKLHRCARKYPGMRGLIVRKTRESMTESVLVTFEEKVVSPADPILAGPDRANRQRYAYPNGSEVIVSGLVAHSHDQKAKIMSTEYDLIVVPEATELSEDEWEKLSSRLRNGRMPYQQILGECNPDSPMHWLHRRCDRGRARCYFARHADNPEITPERLARLAALTGVRRARLFEGKRAQAEGAVYDFDPRVHLIDPFPVPAGWPRFRSIDFGYTNPFTCGWWALDPDDRLYLYREVYHTRRTVRAHAGQIQSLSAGERIEATVADTDAEDRATLLECRIGTLPALKEITVGVQAVQARLAVQGDGRPRLYLMRGALVEADPELAEAKKPCCLEQELPGYAWPKGSDGRPVKEVPVGVDDHGCDQMRYAVRYADQRQGLRGQTPTAGPPGRFGGGVASSGGSRFGAAPSGVFQPRRPWGGGGC
jgi:hypothetical protein